MRILLDTHVVLWWSTSGAARLSSIARDLIESGSTEALVSVVSAFEIAAKARRGRLDLPDLPERYIPGLLQRHGFDVLEVGLTHALRAGSLPLIDRDPFDRLLVAQAQIEGLPIVTADPVIGRYDVETIW